MALGFDVILVGVPGFSYKEMSLPAWKREVPWFDGWELCRSERMLNCGNFLAGLFTAHEVREMQARFRERVRPGGAIAPAPLDAKIISDEEDVWQTMPDIPPPPTVEELDQLLGDPNLQWVIMHLWDRS